jgi:hypothetical protein
MNSTKKFTYTISWSQPYNTTVDINLLNKVVQNSASKIEELRLSLLEKEIEQSSFTEANNYLSKFRS